MAKKIAMGLNEALQLMFNAIDILDTEILPLLSCVDRIAGCDLRANVNSPSIDASLKDGFGIVSSDIASASKSNPVRLKLAGYIAAGGTEDIPVTSGTAVQLLTGAKIPKGADAVVAEEFVTKKGNELFVEIHAEPGRNILAKGVDVALDTTIVQRGQKLTPGIIGILAAAGHSHISVVQNPLVSIVATGDEVVAPGAPLPEGKLYASNISTLGAWCHRYAFRPQLRLVKDNPDALLETFKKQIEESDAMITSGGAWTSDRDLVAQTLARLGWQQVFHRIRIGPGKAVGFGLLDKKPIFILPGGPPSNLIGFLQIALPGLLKLAGHRHHHLPTMTVRLGATLDGGHSNWTQFIFGTLKQGSEKPEFHHIDNASRLRSMAEAEAIVTIPEGKTVLTAGTDTTAQILL